MSTSVQAATTHGFFLSAARISVSLLVASSSNSHRQHQRQTLRHGMAAPAPVEVGARGTIGSLVCREIEYFRRTEAVNHGNGAKKSSKAAANGGSPRSKARPARKKGAGGGAFLPSMCSSAEVAVAAGGEAPRVRYRHLAQEGDAMPQD